MRLLGWILAVLLCAGHALATPSEDLALARDAFRNSRFAEAIPMLTALLYPQTRLADRAELAEAHLLLGVSYFETGDPQPAAREFEEALFIDSTLTLDPLLFSERVVRFFESRKKAMEDQQRASDEARRLAEERDAAYRAMENMYVVEKRDFYVNFIPFGAGQFQNGDRNKGIAFAVSQAAFGATSAGLFTYLITKYRLQNDVPPTEAESVRNLQILQVTTGGITLGLMAWGIVDALIHYQPTVRIEPDKSFLPKNLRDRLEPNRPLKPDLQSSSLELIPMPLANGGGVAASWEF